MSAEKLSTDEVPQKFSEWLLAMGCPAEKVPSIEKMKQMCRGQYYMVWRSLMEHVYAKDVIRQKRLEVFYENVKLYKGKNAFKENNGDIMVPDELLLWNQHTDLKEKVTDAETRVKQLQQSLNKLMNKNSSKLSQCNSSNQHVEDLQRRTWLLRQVSNEMATKKTNLEETKSIAESLCNVDNDQDLEKKLDRCLALMQQKHQPAAPVLLPVASSSIVSSHDNETVNEKEDSLTSLVKCRGDALWPHLCVKRSALVTQLSLVNTKHKNNVVNNRITPQSVLAHTAALHCNIALEFMKNKIQIKQTRDKVAVSVEEISTYITEESSELLVLCCEKASVEARVKSLKFLYDELTSKSGVFHINDNDVNENQATPQKIASIDKCIENTRDDLKRLVTSLAVTERKKNNIKECLLAVFSAFHSNSNIYDNDRCKGIQLDFPKEPISMLRHYYAEKCEKNKDIGNLSLELDVSESSFREFPDAGPRFVDELKIYLKKFNLEKNRKLVLDSGEKIWIFETLRSLASTLNDCWLNDDIPPLLCPSVRLSYTLKELINKMQDRETLTNILKTVNVETKPVADIDITVKIEREAEVADKLKKRISENLKLLQKISKTLELSKENLQFWSEDPMRKYISNDRTVDGKSYIDYEAFFMEYLKLNS